VIGKTPRDNSSSGVSGLQGQPVFASPASTSLDELLQLRSSAVSLQRRTKRRSASQQGGDSVSRRLGRGLDFAEVREYQPGDDVRMIDWKVTARSGQAHTKLFIEERERPILFFVDFRSSMRFGTQGMYKSVLAARLAALLGWCAVAGRDRVGGFVFSDDWHAEIRPSMGRRGLMKLFRAIAQAQRQTPLPVAYPLADTLEKLARSAQGGTTVVLLSDFQGFDDQAKRALGRVVHSLDMIAVHIVDPLDQSLPEGGRFAMTTTNGSKSDNRLSLSMTSRRSHKNYQDRFVERQQSIKQFFAQGGHSTIEANTAAPLVDTALSVLHRK